MLKAILSLFFFCFLESFFAMGEIAFVSAERLLIEKMSKKRSAQICINFWNNPERLFTTTTFGITLSIAGNGMFTSYFLIESLGKVGIFIATFVLPFFILFFGQILPKTLGKKYSFPLVLYLATPLYIISFLFYPIYLINNALSQLLLKREEEKSPYFLTKFREVFLTMISYEEEIDQKERELMYKIMEFGRKKLSQVMIPLSKVKALPIEATVKDAIEFSSKYNFNYIPLYEEDLSHIKYIVKIQSLLGKSLFEGETPLVKFAKSPLFLPEIIPAHEALKIMQKEIQEIAIVVDEYGLVTGLVTIEDLVEEVLGEFRDALDYQEQEIQKISKDTYLVKGSIEIEKLQELGLPIPKGDYETLNGFIYGLANRIPKKGEIFYYKNLELKIEKASPHTVEEVLIKLLKKGALSPSL
ncbi:MAG: hemolysin family protein [Caldimicrobium sp.]